MSKHRRPSRLRIGARPLHIGIAAGVAGTVAITGTVVASASASHHARRDGSVRPTAAAAAFALTNTGSSHPRDAVTYAHDEAAAATADRVGRQFAMQERLTQTAARKAALAEAVRLAAVRRTAHLAAQHQAAVRKAAVRRAGLRKIAERKAAVKRAKWVRSSRAASRSDTPMGGSAASVIAIAAAQQGDSYVHGGDGPDTFDCSGFTMYVFGKLGISLPHSAAAQRGVATRISAAEVRPGDLVFVYNGGGGSVGHVAVYGGPGVWYEAANPRSAVGRRAAWSSNVSYGRVL